MYNKIEAITHEITLIYVYRCVLGIIRRDEVFLL
jgi:hypothetical protein